MAQAEIIIEEKDCLPEHGTGHYWDVEKPGPDGAWGTCRYCHKRRVFKSVSIDHRVESFSIETVRLLPSRPSVIKVESEDFD